MKKRLLSSIIVLAATVSAFAQTTLTGRITDARTGEPLIGASLVPKSSKELGAVTDIDGNFKLVTNVELPLTLSVQFIARSSLISSTRTDTTLLTERNSTRKLMQLSLTC